ncbi:DUF2975 domain-containing protein [Psychromarinibacter sp. C21-152]|uniref:DUF2975 domain-containing protein n=1 Tax=Psychromarinibacter sediminicola TaxID=3033385 RepID=A0AAE3NN92_9RHOB|nr:DUF2975 domain-containing protein [Psychromarinibacter sediminicola]MDF0601098.1 DUF2975 domain-containing protein [Psychromarinibacter sediminicola]
MEDLKKLRRWAVPLQVGAILAMVALSLAVGLGIAFADLPDDLRRAAGLGDGVQLDTSRRVAVGALGALPALAMIYVLGQMAALFALYAAGEALSVRCARRLLNIGAGLFAGVVLELVARPAQILLASLANPPGQQVLSLGVEGADLGQILAAGLLVTVGWTMREAARIAEENRGFV